MNARVCAWLGLSSWLLCACSERVTAAPAKNRAVFGRETGGAAPKTTASLATTSKGSAGGSGCSNASFELRRLASSCFPDRDLCGEILSVDFDDDGIARGARFATTLSAEHTLAAQTVLACVNGKLNALSRCTELRTRSFRKSCTLP